MLELRPNCECCDMDLPPDSRDAMMCSFECTFCRGCAEKRLGGRCPNCGGELLLRPGRPLAMLEKYPASTTRVFKPRGCGNDHQWLSHVSAAVRKIDSSESDADR